MNIGLNKTVLDWIQRYTKSVVIVILILALTYVYTGKEKLQDQLNAVNKEALQAERDRQKQQDQLMQDLLRRQNDSR